MSLFSGICDWLRKNVTTKRAASLAAANFEAQKELLLPMAIDAIKAAASMSMNGPDKLSMVVAMLQGQAPKIATAMLTTFVQTTYENLKADPAVPEVQ